MGSETQALERDVLERMEDLRKALDRELKRRDKKKEEQQQQGQQQQQQGKQPLVPPLAELKMLRGMQEDVNKRTRNLYNALRDAKDGKLNRVQQRLLSRLTDGQGNIRELLQELNENLSQQAQQAAGGGEGEGEGEGEGDGDGEGEGQDGKEGR